MILQVENTFVGFRSQLKWSGIWWASHPFLRTHLALSGKFPKNYWYPKLSQQYILLIPKKGCTLWCLVYPNLFQSYLLRSKYLLTKPGHKYLLTVWVGFLGSKYPLTRCWEAYIIYIHSKFLLGSLSSVFKSHDSNETSLPPNKNTLRSRRFLVRVAGWKHVILGFWGLQLPLVRFLWTTWHLPTSKKTPVILSVWVTFFSIHLGQMGLQFPKSKFLLGVLRDSPTYSAKEPRNKSSNFFPTKYAIPKSLKVSHWLKEFTFTTIWGDKINPMEFENSGSKKSTKNPDNSEVHSKGKGRDQCNGFRLGRSIEGKFSFEKIWIKMFQFEVGGTRTPSMVTHFSFLF